MDGQTVCAFDNMNETFLYCLYLFIGSMPNVWMGTCRGKGHLEAARSKYQCVSEVAEITLVGDYAEGADARNYESDSN